LWQSKVWKPRWTPSTEGGDFIQAIKSFLSWVGGKSKLLWLIDKLFPPSYSRVIDVFGGSGTVLMNRPLRSGCLEVYNDFNSDLVNLFFCVKNRTMALIRELGFLPLNARDDFNVISKFFGKEVFTRDYLAEQLELTERYLTPLQYEEIKSLLLTKAERGDVKRAADYFKLIRYSFSAGGKSFAGKSCDLRKFFSLVWECSRRLSDVVIENKDFQALIEQYDRDDAVFYCDPPYYEAESCYAVGFSKKDHIRLHDALAKCRGYVMVSYNYCPFICDLYQDFYVFYTKRPNSMSLVVGSEYEEIIMTNYDPRTFAAKRNAQLNMFFIPDDEDSERYELIHEPKS